MARKGENIYKRKDGRWEGRYIVGRRENGKARYASIYGKGYLEVKEKLDKRKGDRFKSMPSCQLTVKIILDMWLSLRLTDIKESTYQRYIMLIQLHILPYLGKIRINCLTAEILSDYIKKLLKSGRLDGRGGLAEKTVNDVVSILKSALKQVGRKYAVDGSLFDVKMPAVRKKRVETLGDWECETMSRSILANPDLNGVGYLLALNYGLRLGEVCGLKWSDISFAERTVTVSRTVLRLKNGMRTQLTVQTPKTETSARTIPLTAEMLLLLGKLRNSAPEDAYLLTGKRTLPMEPRTMQYRFKSFLKSHGLKNHHFHALRHTFATRSIERGFDAKTLSEILGHRSVKTTLQLYVHPTLLHKRKIVEAVSSILPIAV